MSVKQGVKAPSCPLKSSLTSLVKNTIHWWNARRRHNFLHPHCEDVQISFKLGSLDDELNSPRVTE